MIDADLIGEDVQAGQSRDDGIAADRVNISPGHRVAHQDEEQGYDQQQDPDRDLHAQEFVRRQ